MTLIETLNYFINDQEEHLVCLGYDIREETNHEVNDLDWYEQQWDEAQQRLEDLKHIKTIVEHLENNK